MVFSPFVVEILCLLLKKSLRRALKKKIAPAARFKKKSAHAARFLNKIHVAMYLSYSFLKSLNSYISNPA